MLVDSLIILQQDASAIKMLSLDYIAGFIDGEGTVGIYRSKKNNVITPYISISNTNYNILCKIAEMLKNVYEIKSTLTSRKQTNVNHKRAHVLNIRWQQAINLAKLLCSKLIIKNKQCDLLANKYNLCTPRNGWYTNYMANLKSDLMSSMKVLNSRGSQECDPSKSSLIDLEVLKRATGRKVHNKYYGRRERLSEKTSRPDEAIV